MRFNDLVFGAVLIAAALLLFLEAGTFPDMPGQDYGPALFPQIIAGGFALCGLSLVVAGVRRLARQKLIGLDPWARQGGHIFDIGLLIGGLVLLMWLWDAIGFLIGATVYATVLATRFRGGRLGTSLIVCFLACLVIDFAFRRLLLVPLPLGPLTGIVW
ncbi:tripartite tricarboxylate transporter TctB family protein [Geminicoccaceae bacterium 1502E]|nr:tripartite tricarboxylate transporter TctB family protein [Geminicoccaceae bacterium 1502E]